MDPAPPTTAPSDVLPGHDPKEDLRPFAAHHRDHRFKLWARVVTPEGAYRHVYWRRIAILVPLVMLTAWLGLAVAAWAYLRYGRDWSQASYRDVALYPFRAREFRASLGNYYIGVGMQHLAEKNYRFAYNYLTAGLRHAPNDLAARRSIALVMVRFGMTPRAITVLEDGIIYRPDLDYMKLLFGWMLELHDENRVIAVAQRILPHAPDRILLHQFVALQVATAHFQRGRYAEAEQWVQQWGLLDSVEGQILAARCDFQRGAKADAVKRLEAELPRFSRRDELYLHLIGFHRELGNEGEVRRLAMLRYFNDRESPGPRMDLLRSYHAADDDEAEQREISAYLRDFAADARALEILAEFAVEMRSRALSEKITAAAQAADLPMARFQLCRARLHLGEGDWADALAACEAAGGETDASADSFGLGLRAVASYHLGEANDGARTLAAYLERRDARIDEALFIAHQFERGGMIDIARSIYARAAALNPSDQTVLNAVMRHTVSNRDRAGLREHLPRYLDTRNPALPLLTEAVLLLDQPEDLGLLQRVRTLLADQATRAATIRGIDLAASSVKGQ